MGHNDLHTIKELKERVWLLEEAVRELLIYASPFTLEAAARCKNGYTSELVPRLTRLGPVRVTDRVEVIRQLVSAHPEHPDPDNKGDAA